MSPIHLPPKFDSYIINNMDNDLRKQLDQIFHKIPASSLDFLSQDNGFQSMGYKDHVVTHPSLADWVIKGPRHDHVISTLPDTHIYRVRKATRIQKVIEKYGFSEVVVPKKFLYEYQGQWFVIAEKLDIDSKATLDNTSLWLYPDHTLKSLTSKQAEEIAYLCFEGKLEDVTKANINFTKDGKIAILDTEPISRAIKKAGRIWLQFIPNLKSTFLFLMSLTNSERLFLMCSSEAGEKVRHVQSKMFWEHLGKIILKTALPLIFSIGAFTLASANPLLVGIVGVAVAVTGINAVLSVGLIALTTFKYHQMRSVIGHYQLAVA